MNWDVLNKNGEKVGGVELKEEVFKLEANDALVHTNIKALLANKRQGTHATKTRSLVSGGGKKPFRQKGTGNARQGSSRSPLMPGGATAHGPQPRSYRQDLNKKQKQLAMRVALSERVRASKLVVVDKFDLESYSTKAMQAFFAAHGVASEKALVVHNESSDKLFKSTRNLFKKNCVHVQSVNLEDVMSHSVLFVSENCVADLHTRLCKG